MAPLPHGPSFTHGNHLRIDSLSAAEWACELCDSLEEYGRIADLADHQLAEAEELTRRLIDLYDPEHWTKPTVP